MDPYLQHNKLLVLIVLCIRVPSSRKMTYKIFQLLKPPVPVVGLGKERHMIISWSMRLPDGYAAFVYWADTRTTNIVSADSPWSAPSARNCVYSYIWLFEEVVNSSTRMIMYVWRRQTVWKNHWKRNDVVLWDTRPCQACPDESAGELVSQYNNPSTTTELTTCYWLMCNPYDKLDIAMRRVVFRLSLMNSRKDKSLL